MVGIYFPLLAWTFVSIHAKTYLNYAKIMEDSTPPPYTPAGAEAFGVLPAGDPTQARIERVGQFVEKIYYGSGSPPLLITHSKGGELISKYVDSEPYFMRGGFNIGELLTDCHETQRPPGVEKCGTHMALFSDVVGRKIWLHTDFIHYMPSGDYYNTLYAIKKLVDHKTEATRNPCLADCQCSNGALALCPSNVKATITSAWLRDQGFIGMVIPKYNDGNFRYSTPAGILSYADNATFPARPNVNLVAHNLNTAANVRTYAAIYLDVKHFDTVVYTQQRVFYVRPEKMNRLIYIVDQNANMLGPRPPGSDLHSSHLTPSEVCAQVEGDCIVVGKTTLNVSGTTDNVHSVPDGETIDRFADRGLIAYKDQPNVYIRHAPDTTLEDVLLSAPNRSSVHVSTIEQSNYMEAFGITSSTPSTRKKREIITAIAAAITIAVVAGAAGTAGAVIAVEAKKEVDKANANIEILQTRVDSSQTVIRELDADSKATITQLNENSADVFELKKDTSALALTINNVFPLLPQNRRTRRQAPMVMLCTSCVLTEEMSLPNGEYVAYDGFVMIVGTHKFKCPPLDREFELTDIVMHMRSFCLLDGNPIGDPANEGSFYLISKQEAMKQLQRPITPRISCVDGQCSESVVVATADVSQLDGTRINSSPMSNDSVVVFSTIFAVMGVVGIIFLCCYCRGRKKGKEKNKDTSLAVRIRNVVTREKAVVNPAPAKKAKTIETLSVVSEGRYM